MLSVEGKRQRRLLSSLICGVVLSLSMGCSPEAELPDKTNTTNAAPSNIPAKPSSRQDGAPFPSFADVVAKVTPAVVNIATTQTVEAPAMPPFFGPGPFGGGSPFEEFFRHFFPDRPRTFKRQSLGSGFITDPQGIIITNHHVVDQADEILVRLKQEEFKAKVLGSDPATDLAVLKIEPDRDLPTLSFGDSSQLRVGDWVIAIGNPFGLSQTVTAGIVSAIDRVIGQGPYDDFIQTDASINPGNSGGPLLNLQGEVIGINTAIFSQTGGNIGIGFAIPSNLARDITEKLRSNGEIERGWLGVTIQDLDKDLAKAFGISEAAGALIANVEKGSPADQAGLKRGDVIVGVDGVPIASVRDLSRKVAAIDPDTEVEFQIIRKGKQQTLTVEVGERPSRIRGQKREEDSSEDKLGLFVAPLTPERARELGIPADKGVLVQGVQPGSPADQAGLQGGDIILEINRKPVSSIEDLQQLIGEAEGPMLFFIRRGDATFFVTLKS